MSNFNAVNMIYNKIKTLFNSHNVSAIYVDSNYKVFEYNPQKEEILYEWHRYNFISKNITETELFHIREQLKIAIDEF